MKHVCLQLKVCEACGALWLRGQTHGVYCQRCAVILADFPPPRGKSRRGRKPKARRVQMLTPACAQ